MRAIASRFAQDMDQVVMATELTALSIRLAQVEFGKQKSPREAVKIAKELQGKISGMQNPSVLFFEGTFLSTCAQYELAVRDLLEKFVAAASAKMKDFNHLPREMRDWHPQGCAKLILNLDKDKHRHLTADQIVRSLASCVTYSIKKPYSLTAEAFSNNENNFRSGVIEQHIDRIGLKKVWQKLSRNQGLQTYLRTNSDALTEEFAKKKLDAIIEKRNHIIHRGRAYAAPGESEVKEAAGFLKQLVTSITDTLEAHRQAI